MNPERLTNFQLPPLDVSSYTLDLSVRRRFHCSPNQLASVRWYQRNGTDGEHAPDKTPATGQISCCVNKNNKANAL